MSAAHWIAGFLLGVTLSTGIVSRAHAAEAYIGVTGVASGNGIVEIVIEDNTVPQLAGYMVTVSVEAGDSPDRTAENIVIRLREALPVAYVTRRDGPCVTIRGPFTLIEVLADVPGQQVDLQETPCSAVVRRSAPSLGKVSLGILAVGCLTIGVVAVRGSRRRTRPA